MPRFTGTPETTKTGGRFGGKPDTTDEAPLSLQTGGEGDAFTGVQETPKPGMTYGEQMKNVGQFYGALGRGAVKGMLGAPGELEYLGAYALPEFLGAKKTPEKERVEIFPRSETVGKMMEQVGLGKSPEQLKGVEFIGELVGGLKGYGARPVEMGAGAVKKLTEPSALQKALSTVQFSGEELAAAAKRAAGYRLTAAEEKALSSAVDAVDRQMTRISGLKEVTSKVSPEIEKLQEAARSEAKLAAPDTVQIRAAGKDLTSEIQRQAAAKLQAAEAKLAGGGEQFEKYLNLGKQLEQSQPVAASPAGQKLSARLLNMSKDMSLTPETRDLAMRTRIKLFPKEGNEAFNTFDVEYRRLVDKAQGKSDVKIGPEEAKVFRTVSGAVEDALKEFVGTENYARPIYAQEAKDLNQFRKDLGDALATRQRGEYEAGKGDIVLSSKPAEVLFKDRQSVRLGRELLGNEIVNSFAERYASNLINGKTSAEISKLLNSEKFAFAYETPGLAEKINKYAQSLATREGDVKAFAELQKQAAAKISEAQKGIAEAKGAAVKETAEAQKAFDTAQKATDELTRALQNEDPAKLYSSFTKMRPKLEETGVFDKAGLDALEADISRASQIADAKQRRDAIVGAIGVALKKVLTLGLR